MTVFTDGPTSNLFKSIDIKGKYQLNNLQEAGVKETTISSSAYAPQGKCTMWGIPFSIEAAHVLKKDKKIEVSLNDAKTNFVLFAHTAEQLPLSYNEDGFMHPAVGPSGLNNLLAKYVFVYSDGTEKSIEICNRQQIGTLNPNMFEDAFQAVSHGKDFSLDPMHVPERNSIHAFKRQGQTESPYGVPWLDWLCAIQNPCPEKTIKNLRLEGCQSAVIISGITIADESLSVYPLRWQTRMKAILTLPKEEKFNSHRPDYDHIEFNKIIEMDMGQIISVKNTINYPEEWKNDSPEKQYKINSQRIIVEFTAHPNSSFYIKSTNEKIKLEDLINKKEIGSLKIAKPSRQEITVKTIDKKTKKNLAVRLHMHGEAGEYLHPKDRHFNPSPIWFNDFGAEAIESNSEISTYINGETQAFMPLGKVFIQVWKGFEYSPIRTAVTITEETKEIVIELENTINWKEKNWISSDTHTHFMAPTTALLEASCEGVNVINILAAPWGDMFTNTGDFDGKTHERIDGNNEKYLARVGLEARQRVLGHMSLCAFDLPMITPMGSGGPTSMPVGDAVEINLCQWARQCRKQNGLAIISHFGHPRAAGSILIVNDLCDGVEVEAFAPFVDYNLSDIYQYFNCGYQITLVAGTDKMGACGKTGWSRTYSKIEGDLSLDAWKESIKTGNTFITQGPMLEFLVNGKSAGSIIEVNKNDEVEIVWECKAARGELTKIQLLSGSKNGAKIVEEKLLPKEGDKGTFKYKVEESTWLAILTRGIRDANGDESVTAHSSSVMLYVDGKKPFSKIDAETIKDQIEGTYNYLQTTAIRPEKDKFERNCKDTIIALEKINKRIKDNETT